jgi:protein gp37
MAEKTGIEWASATWNPWQGCKMVSPGCAKCYMFRDKRRYGQDPSVVVRSATATFNAPLRWWKNWQDGRRDKNAVAPGSRIFTCSWSDWFIVNADNWRDEAWRIVRDTPFVYMILTKRAERIADHLPADWGAGYPNVWLMVTCEDQKRANERWRHLAQVPAAVRGISYEPGLERINWMEMIEHAGVLTKPDWIISGGESDPDPRPFDLEWARATQRFCERFGVAYFHKQHGGNKKSNGAWGGRELDGRTWDEFPQCNEVRA